MSFVRARASWERIGEVLRTPGKRVVRAAPARRVAGTRRSRPPLPAPRSSSRTSRSPTPAPKGGSCSRDVDLACEPGRITAIIGPTGSGKSTLAALVPRFYDADAPARCSWAASTCGTLDLRELRRRIALVPAEDRAVHRHDRGEPPLGPRGCHPRPSSRRRPGAAPPHEFIAGFPEGYRKRARPGRGEPLGRAEAAGGHRAGARAAARGAHPRRLHELRGLHHGGRDPRRHPRHLRGAHLHPDHAADLRGGGRGPGAGAGRRAGRGGRHPRELVRDCEVYRDICVAQLGREALDGPR